MTGGRGGGPLLRLRGPRYVPSDIRDFSEIQTGSLSRGVPLSGPVCLSDAFSCGLRTGSHVRYLGAQIAFSVVGVSDV